MRNKLGILSVSVIALVALLSAIGVEKAASTVIDTKHNLSINAPNPSSFAYWIDDVCVFCHTPHGANMNKVYQSDPNVTTDTGTGVRNLGGRFLWNRALPGRAFSVYSSTTLNSTVSGGPGTLSILCLSCHDGVGALNVLLNLNGQTPGTAPDDSGVGNQIGGLGPNSAINIGNANCVGVDDCGATGTDLRDDHPIGFTYDHTVDTGLKPSSGFGASLAQRMSLTAGRMECSTCHDPHYDSPYGSFLIRSNAGSGLCLECHNK